MKIETYQTPAPFLEKTQVWLEEEEATNNVMLGISARLVKYPERLTNDPYWVTVEDEQGLMVAGMMTPPFQLNLHSNRQDYLPALRLIARDLLDSKRNVPGVSGPTEIAEAFANLWTELSGQTHHLDMNQRVYVLRQVTPPKAAAGHMRLAEEADLDLVTEWIFHFEDDIFERGNMEQARQVAERRVKDRDIYLWVDEVPVSMAAKSRPTRHGITVNLVYTPNQFRQRGYASACVAVLSQQLLDEGWQFCSLFTDLANPTSNSIYQKIGYQPLCDFCLYKFAVD